MIKKKKKITNTHTISFGSIQLLTGSLHTVYAMQEILQGLGYLSPTVTLARKIPLNRAVASYH